MDFVSLHGKIFCFYGITGIERQIYNTFKKLTRDQVLDTTLDDENCKQFLQKFSWKCPIFSKERKKKWKSYWLVLTKFLHIMSGLGINTDCLVKLTAKHDRPI